VAKIYLPEQNIKVSNKSDNTEVDITNSIKEHLNNLDEKSYFSANFLNMDSIPSIWAPAHMLNIIYSRKDKFSEEFKTKVDDFEAILWGIFLGIYKVEAYTKEQQESNLCKYLYQELKSELGINDDVEQLVVKFNKKGVDSDIIAIYHPNVMFFKNVRLDDGWWKSHEQYKLYGGIPTKNIRDIDTNPYEIVKYFYSWLCELLKDDGKDSSWYIAIKDIKSRLEINYGFEAPLKSIKGTSKKEISLISTDKKIYKKDIWYLDNKIDVNRDSFIPKSYAFVKSEDKDIEKDNIIIADIPINSNYGEKFDLDKCKIENFYKYGESTYMAEYTLYHKEIGYIEYSMEVELVENVIYNHVIYPNFISKGYNYYFTGLQISGEHTNSIKVTSYDEDMNPLLIDIQHSEYRFIDNYIKYIQITYNGTSLGLISVDDTRYSNAARTDFETNVAFDFGSSSSSFAILQDGEPIALSITDMTLDLISCGSDIDQAFVDTPKFLSILKQKPMSYFPTELINNKDDTLDIDKSFGESKWLKPMPNSYNNDLLIKENKILNSFKWDIKNKFNGGYEYSLRREYLSYYLFLLLAQLYKNGVRELDKLIFTYPLAFDRFNKTKSFENLTQEIVDEISTKCGVVVESDNIKYMSESVASFGNISQSKEYDHLNIIVDMGGSTTDVFAFVADRDKSESSEIDIDKGIIVDSFKYGGYNLINALSKVLDESGEFQKSNLLEYFSSKSYSGITQKDYIQKVYQLFINREIRKDSNKFVERMKIKNRSNIVENVGLFFKAVFEFCYKCIEYYKKADVKDYNILLIGNSWQMYEMFGEDIIDLCMSYMIERDVGLKDHLKITLIKNSKEESLLAKGALSSIYYDENINLSNNKSIGTLSYVTFRDSEFAKDGFIGQDTVNIAKNSQLSIDALNIPNQFKDIIEDNETSINDYFKKLTNSTKEDQKESGTSKIISSPYSVFLEDYMTKYVYNSIKKT
jgi:hypothetical protein